MKVIADSATSKDKEVRLLAMQCFVRTAEFHYDHISSYFEGIWNVSTNLLIRKSVFQYFNFHLGHTCNY